MFKVLVKHRYSMFTILKIALLITKLLKERNVSGRKHESLVRTKKRTKGAFIREISKSTTYNFLRTTSPLQKMSSAPDKHSVKTRPSVRWGAGKIRAESKGHRPQDIRYHDSTLSIHRRGYATMVRTQRLFEPLTVLSWKYWVFQRYQQM